MSKSFSPARLLPASGAEPEGSARTRARRLGRVGSGEYRRSPHGFQTLGRFRRRPGAASRRACSNNLRPCNPASTKTRALVTKAERARDEGDGFLAEYTTDRRTTFSTIFAELERVAHDAGIQPRPASYELDQVEGSDSLYQMNISAAYEGSYASLTKFVNLLDKSPRFLIIESLIAAPQQSNAGDLLSVSIKLDTFVREQPVNPI